MSQSFLDRGELVGYDFEAQKLVVTLSERMAKKMAADGWKVAHDDTLGFFVTMELVKEPANADSPVD